MNPTHVVKEGDSLPAPAAVLSDAAGPLNLTGATVRFHARQVNGTKRVMGTAEILDASEGSVRYNWQVTDTDTPDDYMAEWEVTFSSGQKVTIPNDGFDYLLITPDLG